MQRETLVRILGDAAVMKTIETALRRVLALWRKDAARDNRQAWTKSGAAFALGAALAAAAAYGFSRLNRQLQDGGHPRLSEQLRQQADQTLAQTRNAVEHTAHVAGERLEQTREVVGKTAQTLGARVSETAPELVSRVGQTVGQTAQVVGERLEQARERLGAKADEAAVARFEIDAQVSDLAQQAGSVAQEAASQAREQVDRIVEQIETGAGDKVDQVQEVAAEARAVAGETGEAAREQVERIVEQIETGTNDASGQVETVAKDAAEEVSTRLGASESLGHEARRREPGAEQAVDVAEIIAEIVPGIENDGERGLISVDAPITEVPALSGGMKVVAVDGTDIGRVKDVREDGFVLSRPRGADLLAPLDSVYKVEDTLVYLRIKANQVARQGWESLPTDE